MNLVRAITVTATHELDASRNLSRAPFNVYEDDSYGNGVEYIVDGPFGMSHRYRSVDRALSDYMYRHGYCHWNEDRTMTTNTNTAAPVCPLTLSQCRQLYAKDPDLFREAVECLQYQPEWLPEPLTADQIVAVNEGGCASGAYMPAVTYATALRTMAEHGDEVIEYIYDCGCEIPQISDSDDSWQGYCSRLLSLAVELFCSQFSELEYSE